VNLGTGRIIVIIVLVAGGIAILANGFSGGGVVAATSPSPTASPHHSHSPSPSGGGTGSTVPTGLPSPQAPKNVTVAVFNGTNSAGLAAQGDQQLTTAGYISGQAPANSPVPGVVKTTIYYRGGSKAAENQADAQQIADTVFKGAKVALLGSDFQNSVSSSVQVLVVLGSDYAATSGG
jgi:hypothetical protein